MFDQFFIITLSFNGTNVDKYFLYQNFDTIFLNFFQIDNQP